MSTATNPPPPIAPLPDGHGDRPHWTVAFPTYNVDEHYFEAALRSVLDQDPGSEHMEILVSDNCSVNGVSERVAQRLAPGRIAFHRNPSNLGLSGNWNACIERARGRWVHILHADDLVSPGFYEHLGRAEREAPDSGAAICRFSFIDQLGHWTQLGALERTAPGILDGWLDRIARSQRVQCAAFAVKRSTYEAIGGYRSDLYFALDWEMLVRIAVALPVWYDPAILAHFRMHGQSESDRLHKAGLTKSDLLLARDIVRGYIPAHLGEIVATGMIQESPPPRRARPRDVARGLTPPIAWRAAQALRRTILGRRDQTTDPTR